MNKRAFDRFPAFLNAKLHYENNSHDVFILNLSQNGIFFISKEYLSSGVNIEISISLYSKELKVPMKIVRISERDIIYFRFGAKLLNPSQKYIMFIEDRKSM